MQGLRTPDSQVSDRDASGNARAVVLVEGVSDQRALEALAARRGRDLDAERVSVVPIGGVQAIGRYLERFGPRGLGIRLAGLCDAAEEGDVQRGLQRAGLGANLTRAETERLGFYVCVADLEDELIRSLGAAAVEQVLDAQGELRSFRTFQKQPAWRGRTPEEQLRRGRTPPGGPRAPWLWPRRSGPQARRSSWRAWTSRRPAAPRSAHRAGPWPEAGRSRPSAPPCPARTSAAPSCAACGRPCSWQQPAADHQLGRVGQPFGHEGAHRLAPGKFSVPAILTLRLGLHRRSPLPQARLRRLHPPPAPAPPARRGARPRARSRVRSSAAATSPACRSGVPATAS